VVLQVKQETLNPPSGNGVITGSQDISIRILSGEKAGAIQNIRNYLNYTTNFRLKAGNHIIVRVDIANQDFYLVNFYSIDREPALYGLALLFFALLCAVGGTKGFRSIPGIIITFAGFIFLFVPLLYRGFPPVASAMLIAALTVSASLLFMAGLNTKTVSAVLGALVGLIVSAVIAFIFQYLLEVSGYTSSDADYLFSIADHTGMKLGELLFASIVISSLGAVMDISISIASVINEVHSVNPALGVAGLFRSGMNVGRDIAGMMSNTLILAFVGAGFNVLVTVQCLNYSFLQILNSNTIIIDMIQAFSGSMAVILTAPATSLITALLIIRKPLEKRP
jgi:uncharacterized membrane protein